MLDGLLYHHSEVSPRKYHTDGGGVTDAVFGLFWLLGYQFSAGLADLGDAKLWRIDRKADHGPFNSIANR